MSRLSPPRWLKIGALQFYRLAVLVLLAWIIREHHVRLRVEGDAPIAIEEVRGFLPQAASFATDHSPRQGLFIEDATGREIGFAVRTLPICNNIIGYCGVTDVLVVFDQNFRVLGTRVRSSEDTRSHLEDVLAHRKFMKLWNAMHWDEVAAQDLKAAGIEGVSGATMTSMAIAESITARLRSVNQELARTPPFRFKLRDGALALVVVLGGVMAFTHLNGRRWLRRLFQVVIIGYVGLISGDLLAQSLLAGWARSGVPWTLAPGLVFLALAAFLVPWTTRKPLYCLHLCPHGAAQEWLGRISPARWRVKVPAPLASGLRWLPGLLLLFVLLVVMLVAPFDLAGIEPFDAYLLRSAGLATIAVAIAGLIAAIFIPQAYCKYGCPTGALLEFVRSRGAQDRFGRRDLAAALMLGLTALIYWKYSAFQPWLLGFSP